MVLTRSWRLTAEISGGRWNRAPRREASARVTYIMCHVLGGQNLGLRLHAWRPMHQELDSRRGSGEGG